MKGMIVMQGFSNLYDQRGSWITRIGYRAYFWWERKICRCFSLPSRFRK